MPDILVMDFGSTNIAYHTWGGYPLINNTSASGANLGIPIDFSAATATYVTVSDDDALLDEVDANQTLANTTNFSTVTMPAGALIYTLAKVYVVAPDGSSAWIAFVRTSLPGDPIDAYPPYANLVIVQSVNGTFDPSLTYSTALANPSFPFSFFEADGIVPYLDPQVPCFARGTMIETEFGPCAIEDLRRGDLVKTRDDGFQEIRWIGSRRISANELLLKPGLLPIRIKAGALGPGCPAEDLLVSPQHRIMVSSKITKRLFGTAEVLVAAKHLTQLPGVDVAMDVSEVEYFHFLFDRHQIVFAQCAPAESLYTGPQALKALSPEAVKEIFEILPDIAEIDADRQPQSARPISTGRQARMLAYRHVKNQKPLLNHPGGQSRHLVDRIEDEAIWL